MKNYNATVAKVRAMYGKRITPQDYTEMMNKQTISEAAEYLKRNTHYSGALSAIDTNTVHRGMLENLLRRSVFEAYMKITGFERISKQEFYNYKIVQTEIDEILRCIRFINARSRKMIADVPIYMNSLTSFDLLELARITEFGELLAFLRKTPYCDVLKKVEVNGEGQVDVTKCETLLRSYYISLMKKSLHFRKRDAEQFVSLLESDVDLINVINAYRLTAFFGESEEVIEKDMLPFYGKLSAAKQKEIYSAPNSEEFIKKFSKTYYGKAMTENGYDINDIEHSARQLRHKYAKLALKRSSSAPLSVYAFIFLMEIEVQNIISIIEGIRYGVEAGKIASLIIM